METTTNCGSATSCAALNVCRLCVFYAIVLLTVSSVAGAADTDATISEFLDLNGDHRISYDEFVHSIAVKTMREMDADKDGSLSFSEAVSAAKEDTSVPHVKFSEADANGDGRVSLDELKQAIHANKDVYKLFQKLDKDQDGFLSESELKSIQAAPQIRFQF